MARAWFWALNNTKQVIFLGSEDGRREGGDGDSFLAYEIEVILELNLPIVIANLCQTRNIVMDNIPHPLHPALVHVRLPKFEGLR